jgi:hypothetical protein
VRRVSIIVFFSLILTNVSSLTARADAAVCTFDPSTATMAVAVTGAVIINTTDLGEILIEGESCAPAATTTSVDLIRVTGSAGADRLTIDAKLHPFAPGPTPEESSLAEIEFEVVLLEERDVVSWRGRSSENFIVARHNGLDVNGDGDVDLSPDATEEIRLIGGNDSDTIQAMGSRSGDALVTNLHGGPGEDVLKAAGGEQVLRGGAGIDALWAGGNDDVIDGGKGRDSLTYLQSPRRVLVNLERGVASGWGSDEIENVEAVVGSHYGDVLVGDDLPNDLFGRDGRDLIVPQAGNDTVFGGPGHDTLDLHTSSAGVKVDLEEGAVTGDGRDRIDGFADVLGTRFADRFIGSNGADEFRGLKGRDSALGRGGHDRLRGGRSNDRLLGGNGDDEVAGEAGWDRCHQDLGFGPVFSCEDPHPWTTRGFVLARGHSRRVGSGRLVRFSVEVQRGSGMDPVDFARDVSTTLFDPRGWTGREVALKRVDDGSVDLRILLAVRSSVDRLCAPVETKSVYSCFNETRDRVVINLWRWKKGSPAYPNSLALYRRYVVNHEVGHALGHDHYSCPGKRAVAPVMKPQTATAPRPCRSNPWPLAWERKLLA